MICLNCKEYGLVLSVEALILSNYPKDYYVIEEVFESCVESDEEDFECDNCGNKVVKGESYIYDDEWFYEIIFKYIATQIMQSINSCKECGSGAEIQDIYPSIKSCYYDEDDDPIEIFNEIDTSSSVEEVIDEFFSELFQHPHTCKKSKEQASVCSYRKVTKIIKHFKGSFEIEECDAGNAPCTYFDYNNKTCCTCINPEINKNYFENLYSGTLHQYSLLWSNYYGEIVKYISCPHCKNGTGENYEDKTNYGRFYLGTEVYTDNDIDFFNHNFYGDEVKEVNKIIFELAENISFEELVDLKNEYVQNKLYSSRHPVFSKLELFIKKFYSEQGNYILSSNRLMFRTRTSNEATFLNSNELWEAPCTFVSQGRYNDIGVSVLYCANNKDIIKKEVILPDGFIYNIAKFIVRKSMCLFPINYVFRSEFSGLINEPVPEQQQNTQFKMQYILSNIVSAICLQIGYDGIAYISTKDDISVDYAIFCKYEKGVDLEILDVETSL